MKEKEIKLLYTIYSLHLIAIGNWSISHIRPSIFIPVFVHIIHKLHAFENLISKYYTYIIRYDNDDPEVVSYLNLVMCLMSFLHSDPYPSILSLWFKLHHSTPTVFSIFRRALLNVGHPCSIIPAHHSKVGLTLTPPGRCLCPLRGPCHAGADGWCCRCGSGGRHWRCPSSSLRGSDSSARHSDSGGALSEHLWEFCGDLCWRHFPDSL